VDVDGKIGVSEGTHSSTRLLAGDARQHQATPTLIEATLEHACPLPMKADWAGMSIISCRLILLRVTVSHRATELERQLCDRYPTDFLLAVKRPESALPRHARTRGPIGRMTSKPVIR
jgi:hypothetical protein